jgi:hypothetical protein
MTYIFSLALLFPVLASGSQLAIISEERNDSLISLVAQGPMTDSEFVRMAKRVLGNPSIRGCKTDCVNGHRRE